MLETGDDIRGAPLLIVIAKLRDEHAIARRFVDQSVFVVDASGPIAGKPVFQRFGLADSLKRLPLNLFDQCVDPFEYGFISLLPMQVVLPRLAGKREFQGRLYVFPVQRFGWLN